ncbi:MAG TPA: hypothetical protein VGO58_01245 [Chitinophagaceae bacterium]|jgi:hypothetical protein|nr:hypothetical protein [Chitinophagaceae bacterium]
MFRWLAILLISFMLSGCTMISFTYFRNYTDQPVDIVYSTSNLPFQTYTRAARFRNSLVPIERNIWKRLNDSLPIIYYGSVAILTVPPRSTILVPRELLYDTLVLLRQVSRTDTIRFTKYPLSMSGLQYKGVGFPVTSIYYYDFK